MHCDHIPMSIKLLNPPHWAGNYIRQQGSWSWYHNGKSNTPMPHITIGAARIEYDHLTGELLGFHISVPIESGRSAVNAHFAYSVKSGVARFTREFGEKTSQAREATEQYGEANWQNLNALAEEFWKQAREAVGWKQDRQGTIMSILKAELPRRSPED
jgi:hypothetical protein